MEKDNTRKEMAGGIPRLGVTILASGSSGNCTIVHYGNQAVMIDAGLSGREMQRRFRQCRCLEGIEIQGILVTHEHTDHISGLRTCSEKLEAPISATANCARTIRAKDSKIKQMATFAAGGSFDIGPFSVTSFSIPHDANDPVAFIITVNEQRIGIATDVGYVSSTVEYRLNGCDALVLESNHDINMLVASARPWSLKQRIMGRNGHLSNDSSAQLLEKIISPNTRKIVLAHLSHECNTQEKALECAGQAIHELRRNDILLTVAQQEVPLETVWLEAGE